jgi:hypothetical protein
MTTKYPIDRPSGRLGRRELSAAIMNFIAGRWPDHHALAGSTLSKFAHDSGASPQTVSRAGHVGPAARGARILMKVFARR